MSSSGRYRRRHYPRPVTQGSERRTAAIWARCRNPRSRPKRVSNTRQYSIPIQICSRSLPVHQQRSFIIFADQHSNGFSRLFSWGGFSEIALSMRDLDLVLLQLRIGQLYLDRPVRTIAVLISRLVCEQILRTHLILYLRERIAKLPFVTRKVRPAAGPL